MKILLVNNNTQHLDELKKALAGHEVEIQEYNPGIWFHDAAVAAKARKCTITINQMFAGMNTKCNLFAKQTNLSLVFVWDLK
jgi:hypothetical protein